MSDIIKGVVALGVVVLTAAGVKLYGNGQYAKGYAKGASDMYDILQNPDAAIEEELKRKGYAVR